jgi:hypothetical protein
MAQAEGRQHFLEGPVVVRFRIDQDTVEVEDHRVGKSRGAGQEGISSNGFLSALGGVRSFRELRKIIAKWFVFANDEFGCRGSRIHFQAKSRG